MPLRGNVHVWLGSTETQSPGISTVLHWQPPDIHIFGTDPSLVENLKYWCTIHITISGLFVLLW